MFYSLFGMFNTIEYHQNKIQGNHKIRYNVTIYVLI